MRNTLILFLTIAAALAISCGEDTTATADFRLGQPVAGEVSGSSAVVSCQVTHGAVELSALSTGFLYGSETEDLEDYRRIGDPVCEGHTIRCRLTGLAPSTRYRVFAYLEMGTVTMLSAAAEFVTSDRIGADETSLRIAGGATVVLSADAAEGTIAYEAVNPLDGGRAEATCEAAWVHLSASTQGRMETDDDGMPVFAAAIPFAVDANTGDARTAVVTLAYPGAESRQVRIEQERGASSADPAKVIELNAYSGWPEQQYPQNQTVQLGDYRYLIHYAADFGNGIQLKSAQGFIANTEDMGVIRKIEVVYSSKTAQKNIRCFLGDEPAPSGNEVEAVADGDTHTFDCTKAAASSLAADGFRYFKLLNGSGASYLVAIRIHTGGDGGQTPGPGGDAPTFGTPVCRDVTSGGATLSCSYDYAGAGTVSAVYFVYRSPTGSEQRADVTTGAGTKRVAISGLAASTLYSCALCVEIDGAVYRSASASFVTAAAGDRPSGGVYRSGWPELPVELENSDYHYAHHICPDFRSARNFTVCYSAEHHCPVWVSAPLHNCYTGSNGNRNYGPDPAIPANIQPSSKTVGSPYNKGHMLGNRERSATSGMNKQVSYYTNMAPQHGSTFNTGGGAWNNLEDYIDGLWCSDTLYMVTGCRFDTWTDTYGNTATPGRISFGGVQASIPTVFYYVLLRTKKGNSGKSVLSCSADELQCVGFVMSHAMGKGHKPSRADMRSVEWIESFTGFTFFSNVPQAPKSVYDAADWGL